MHLHYSKPSIFVGIIAVFISSFFTGCSKSSDNSTPKSSAPTLSITSLSTTSGLFNSQVTITGTGFASTLASNQIFFNGKTAVIYTQISANSIIALVPLGAGTGPVTITVNGVTATGPVFTYQTGEVVTTFAGNNALGFTNGTGTAASFGDPQGLAVDASGNIYVADQGNNAIRKITPAGVVSTIAGSGAPGATNGIGTAATFNQPTDVAIDASGNLYVADWGNCLIRKITPSGQVSTFAGDGLPHSNDGAGTAASFNSPTGIVVDASGNIFVADQSNALIREISPSGVVTTFAGNTLNKNSVDGTGTTAGFSNPTFITIDKSGNLYVTDQGSNSIRKVTPAAVVTTLAGGTQGSSNGTGRAASFYNPAGIAVDANNNVYVADQLNATIRMITQTGIVTTFAGGIQGYQDGAVASAQFGAPFGLAIDGSGNIYVSDAQRIRKIFND